MTTAAENISMRRDRWVPFVVLILVCLGFYLRIFGGLRDTVNDWIHPDENRMSMACNQVNLYPLFQLKPRFESWESFTQSLQPLNSLNPRFFAYGSLPIYLYRFAQFGVQSLQNQTRGNRFAVRFLETFRDIYAIGRVITAISGALTILLTYLLAVRVYDRRIALLAAAFLTFTVLHVQLSHFMTVDVLMVFFISLALLAMLRVAGKGTFFSYQLAGFLWGLALAVKLNALMLAVIYGLAHLAYLIRSRSLWRLKSFKQWVALALSGVVMAGTFFACMPFSYFDYPEFRRQMIEESEKVSGVIVPPYMVQYQGTPAYLYQAEQMINWSFGPPLGIIMFLGLIWGAYDTIRRFHWEKFLLLLWTVLYFGVVGNLQVKWLRHMLPMYPALCIFGAAFLPTVMRLTKRRWLKGFAAAGVAIALAWSVVYSLAFLDIYRYRNTRYRASVWIYENIPNGANIVDEHWDEGLPHPLPGYWPTRYHKRTLETYEGVFTERSNPKKYVEFADILASSDYIFMNSKRLYGSVTRDPARYPICGDFYRQLFAGRLGYKIIKTVTTYPRFLNFELVDDLADESFSVYDHPKATIFQNVEHLDANVIYERIMNPPENIREIMPLDKMLLARAEGEEHRGWSGFAYNPEPPAPVEEPEWKKEEVAETVQKAPAREVPSGPRTMFQGGLGSGPGQFSEPRDILYNTGNHLVYVMDFRNYRIQAFDLNGAFQFQWGGEKSDAWGKFNDPSGLGLDPDGNIVAVDTWNQRVQVFSQTGRFLGGYRETLGLFAPTDIAFDSEGFGYITDSGNSKVKKVNRKYQVLVEMGGAGSEPGQMKEPMGIAVAPGGKVFVADSQNHRIELFTDKGAFQKVLHIPLQGEFPRVNTFLALGPAGNIYVSDPKTRLIYVFSPNWELVKFYDGREEFEANLGITVLPDGTALVADTGYHRIVKLKPERFKLGAELVE